MLKANMKNTFLVGVLFLSLLATTVATAQSINVEDVIADNFQMELQIADVSARIDSLRNELVQHKSLLLPPPGQVSVPMAEYDALIAEAYKQDSTDALAGQLVGQLITSYSDLLLGKAQEFSPGSETTESGFPVSDLKTVRDLITTLRSSVLLFSQFSRNTGGGGHATAFLIAPDLAVTNSHNIRDPETGELTDGDLNLMTTKGNIIQAAVVGDDPSADIALLRLQSPLELPLLKWASAEEVAPGTPVFTIGNPAMMGRWVTHVGTLNEYRRVDYLDPAITHHQVRLNLPCMKGCSGSPIFNLDGEVIAVLYGGQDSSMEKYPIPLEVHGSIKFWKEDISLATSSQQASELVEKFLADEAVK